MKLLNHFQDLSSPVKRAEGHYLLLESNRKILDFSLGSGAQIFGHSYGPVVRSLGNAIANYQVHGCLPDSHHKVTSLIGKAIPDTFAGLVFSSSGSEATQRAIRYARQISGKQKIAHFWGNWHGMNEWTLLDDGSRLGVDIKDTGIPQETLNKTRVTLTYGSLDELKETLLREDVGALIIESVPGATPLEFSIDFLSSVLKVCKELGIVSIVDEMISGFRVNIGGVCGTYDLNPDLITYGKIIGAGYPIGITAISESALDSLMSNSTNTVLTGGTFSGNPIALTGVLTILELLSDFNYSELDATAVSLRSEINILCRDLNLPVKAIGFHSISRLVFTDREFFNRDQRDRLELENWSLFSGLKKNMLDKHGVYLPKNGLLFTCSLTTNVEKEKLMNSLDAELRSLKRAAN
ncbi:MAG: aminotransferase class III-fold pyridoxal phosphate-dependent enzyme [Leptolyngbyaceae bacterium]|nr:aminotransferase class III-fold pyridoxal phosphate-dependent enzyme [Leptolyngbyaceae bacterium]